VSFTDAIKSCFNQYAGFKGRASRSEYWWFALFTVLVSMGASMLGEVVNGLVTLALLLPSIAVGARRLHDIGKTGWLQLLWIVPLVGWIFMIYWTVQPTGPANEHGDGPQLGSDAVALPPGAV